MNVMKKKPRVLRENIDTIFWKNLDKLEGPHGVQGLVNDNPDLMSKIHKAIEDKEGLPEDLNNPETEAQAEAVDEYALELYYLFCEGAEIAEAMMVGAKVQREYEKAMEDRGETMSDYDKMIDAGHSSGDF